MELHGGGGLGCHVQPLTPFKIDRADGNEGVTIDRSDVVRYSLYVVWAVGIALMVATMYLDWVTVDATMVTGQGSESLTGWDVRSMHGVDAVPGGVMGTIVLFFALVSAVLLVMWAIAPERMGNVATQVVFVVMTAVILLMINDVGSGFSIQASAPPGFEGGTSVDTVPSWIQDMFGPGLVSADVGFSVWRYLAVAGLLVSWISSLVLLRKGSDGMPE